MMPDNTKILPLLLMATTVPLFFILRCLLKLATSKSLLLSTSLPGAVIPITKFQEIYCADNISPTTLGIKILILVVPALWIFNFSALIAFIALVQPARSLNDIKVPLWVLIFTSIMFFLYVFTYDEYSNPF